MVTPKLIGRPPVIPVAAFCFPFDGRRSSALLCEEGRIVRLRRTGALRARQTTGTQHCIGDVHTQRPGGCGPRPDAAARSAAAADQPATAPRSQSQRPMPNCWASSSCRSFKDAVHKHDSVPPALAPYCCGRRTAELCSLAFSSLDFDEYLDSDGRRRSSPVLAGLPPPLEQQNLTAQSRRADREGPGCVGRPTRSR